MFDLNYECFVKQNHFIEAQITYTLIEVFNFTLIVSIPEFQNLRCLNKTCAAKDARRTAFSAGQWMP